MNFSTYLNWIIKHISDYEVIYFKSSLVKESLDQAPDQFIITHICPYTGRRVHVLSIKIIGNDIIDSITELKLAKKSNVYIDALKDFAFNKEQELLDKGENNIEDEA